MRLLALAFAAITAFAVLGNDKADTIKVCFSIDCNQFEPSLGKNKETMDCFIELVKKAKADDIVKDIIVKSYTSPDGSSEANAVLSQRRCDAIADLLVRRTGVMRSLIRKMPMGIAWNELRNLVAIAPDVPSRSQILNIIDNTPVWVFDADGCIIDGRKKQLMELAGGRPYNWMSERFFPSLRCAEVVLIVSEPKNDTLAVYDSVSVADLESGERAGKYIAPAMEGETSCSATLDAEPIVMTEKGGVVTFADNSSSTKWSDRFALKTNLLYCAALMPNLEIEWAFADRWSFVVEAQRAWYSKKSHHKVYHLSTIGPEVRFWAISRSRFHGMYVGAFGAWGRYDLSNGKKGYEGEGYMGGLSLGYMWPIGSHLSLDAGIGVGYMHTRCKKYLPDATHSVYLLKKDIDYIGPLRLNLSLVWRFANDKFLKKSTAINEG